MRKATIQDLELELWLRKRNSGFIIWTTKDGKNISIKDMDNNHLVNTFKMLLKQETIAECSKDIKACDEIKHNMDSRQLTNLLSFIADNCELKRLTGAKLKPEFTKKSLLNKFPFLTEAQINHILKII